LDTFEKKYLQVKGKKKYPSNEELISFASIILQALGALRAIGINFKNLSSHNVLIDTVDDKKKSPLVPRLTDIEDLFMGVTPHYDVQIKKYTGRVHQDSVAFMELLKELPEISELQLLIEKIEREDTSVEDLLTMIGAQSTKAVAVCF
jgi:hypothetical protein